MTLSGIMLKQRDIVLIPIPFTDLTSQKKRPAIIISSDVLKTFGRVKPDILAKIKDSILKLIEQQNASSAV